MNGATPSKLKPALIAGVACGVASSIPVVGCINFCCCALAIGGGFLASFLYLRAAPPTPDAPYGTGAVLGLGTGATAAVVTSVLVIPMAIIQKSLGLDRAVLNMMDRFIENMPAEAAEAIRQSMEKSMSTEFQVGVFLTQFVTYLVLFSIFALIGGIIGVAVLHKKQVGGGAPPQTGAAPPPPPSPGV